MQTVFESFLCSIKGIQVPGKQFLLREQMVSLPAGEAGLDLALGLHLAVQVRGGESQGLPAVEEEAEE